MSSGENMKCQWCEKEFIPQKGHPNQRYCDKKCSRAAFMESLETRETKYVLHPVLDQWLRK